MKYVSLIIAVVGLLSSLVDFLKRRQLISAAEAEAVRNALDDAHTRLGKVHAASSATRAAGVPDDSKIFRD